MACPTDSPTQPKQNPVPIDPAPSAEWAITVVTTDSQLETGESAIIGITVMRASDGQTPPDGATVVVSTTLGDLGAAGSGIRSTALLLGDGLAAVELFAGEQVGTAVVQAQLEQSSGQVSVQINSAEPFIVLGVDPGSGREGDTVTIIGSGFSAPVRVLFGGDGGEPAEILSLSSTAIVVKVPPFLEPGSIDVTVIINFGTPGADGEPQSLKLTKGFIVLEDEEAVFGVRLVDPNEGCEGDLGVEVHGVGFKPDGFLYMRVFFGDSEPAEITSLTTTRIKVTVPPFAGAPGDLPAFVTVKVIAAFPNEDDNLESSLTFGFKYLDTCP